jgi:hypothetical protein
MPRSTQEALDRARRNPSVADPTTCGLGDTFVSGVLAADAQGKAARWT